MNIIEKLDQLADFRSQMDSIVLQENEASKAAIPDELRKTLDDIEVEFSERMDVISELVTGLEKEIKADVLVNRASVKGICLHAIWNKGRVSWDNKALDGYMVAHPELEKLRKQGKPSVTIRSIGGTK